MKRCKSVGGNLGSSQEYYFFFVGFSIDVRSRCGGTDDGAIRGVGAATAKWVVGKSTVETNHAAWRGSKGIVECDCNSHNG